MDSEGFDPRYSPEYQRGFDPAVHNGPEASPQTHERIPTAEEGRATHPARIPPVPTAYRPGADQAESASPADVVAGEPDAAEMLDDSVVASPPWRNPYLVTLAVLGVALLGAGIGAFRWSVEQVYDAQFGFGGEATDEAREAYLAAQLAWGLSPLLALAGVLTLLGVVFFVALRWAPRPLADYDDEDEQAGFS